MNNPEDTCKCGSPAVVTFPCCEPVCYKCIKNIVIIDSGATVDKNSIVRDDEGYFSRIRSTVKVKDAITGLSFHSKRPLKTVDGSYISRKTARELAHNDLIVRTSHGLCLKKDLTKNLFGYPILKKFTHKKKCSECGFIFVDERESTQTLCFECSIKQGVECSMCNNITKDTFFRDFNKINEYDKYLPIVCDKCLKFYMPLHYKSGAINGVGRKIGIEIECEPTFESQKELALWEKDGSHMVSGSEDGSLRGPFPAEFISPILHESNYEEWVDEFCKRLKARVYIRCGYHCHIDTSDMTWIDMYFMACYLKKYEKFFFSLVSPSRRISTDGARNAGLPTILPRIPVIKSREQWLSFLYGKDHSNTNVGCMIHESKRANDRHIHYSGAVNRYQWFNIHGHYFKGAVEIRSHQGTTNPVKIKNWVELWLNILPHAALGPSKWKHPWVVMPKHLESYYKRRVIELDGVSTRNEISFK